VLTLEPSNIEAIASLGSHHFYNDQPEVALKFYRRLLQMGLHATELWNNIGLCCFYASQYDMTLDCFQRALAVADDDNMADIWCGDGAWKVFRLRVLCDNVCVWWV
jgi:tetratricopeptide repeat protein 8